MYSNKWWVKETVVHPWILEFCLAIKGNRLSVLSTTLIYVGGIMLSEKEPHSKGHIVYDFFYLTFSKWQTYTDWEQPGDCQESGWGGWGVAWLQGAAQEGVRVASPSVIGQLCILITLVVTQICCTRDETDTHV